MIIESLAILHDWCRVQADACGALDGLGAAAAAHAAEDFSAVVWRHALGQGLRAGDDWGWILDMYDPPRIREIVAASLDSQAAAEKQTRRRGY